MILQYLHRLSGEYFARLYNQNQCAPSFLLFVEPDHTLMLPLVYLFAAKIRPGFWTTVIPVSSMLNSWSGVHCCTCTRLKPAILAILVGSGVRSDSSGKRLMNPRAHSIPAIFVSLENGWFIPFLLASSVFLTNGGAPNVSGPGKTLSLFLPSRLACRKHLAPLLQQEGNKRNQ